MCVLWLCMALGYVSVHMCMTIHCAIHDGKPETTQSRRDLRSLPRAALCTRPLLLKNGQCLPGLRCQPSSGQCHLCYATDDVAVAAGCLVSSLCVFARLPQPRTSLKQCTIPLIAHSGQPDEVFVLFTGKLPGQRNSITGATQEDKPAQVMPLFADLKEAD
ncbi:hypothetical protein BaRGS_00002355 [Batillaria attramentaria]|uniref:Secreted protein n=1 Tax=Batillaria attramentaria TaxID=370345 RepID=A0ABD0M3H3_9CAEN